MDLMQYKCPDCDGVEFELYDDGSVECATCGEVVALVVIEVSLEVLH